MFVMKRKSCRALGIFVLMALFAFGLSSSVFAQSAQKETSQFANLVVFVQFSDTGDNFMDAEKTANAEKYYLDTTYPKSLTGYVNTISYGQEKIVSSLPQLSTAGGNAKITPITLSGTRGSYSDSYTVVDEAVTLLKKQVPSIDTANYDLDGNSSVDNVTFIFAGAQNESERGGLFYPHKENYYGTATLNGKALSCINVLMADDALTSTSLSREGVICHEFMHSLGYPDLYHESDDASPVGPWDLMAQESTFMAMPLTYLRKNVSGWLTMDTITQTTSGLTLVPADQASGSQAYILKSPLSDSEFFVVEYRKQNDWLDPATYLASNKLDTKVPGTGLIVYRINSRIDNLSNRLGKTDGVYIFRQGETSVTAATTENFSKSFFSAQSGRTEFGSTDLNATIADNALVYSDGQNSGIKLSNIGSAGDTISFDVTFADTSNAGVWNTLGNTYVSETGGSFLDSAVDANGNVYVLHDENSTLKLAKYDQTQSKWISVGTPITDYSGAAALTYYDGKPWLFYNTGSTLNGKLVYWDGAQWVTAFTTSESNINNLALEAGSDGVYFAYAAGPTEVFTNTLYCKQYTAGGITNLTSPEIDSCSYSQMHFSTDSDSVYFSCRNANNNNQIIAYKLNGTSFTAMQVPSTGAVDPIIYAKDGTLWLLASNENTTNKTELYKYDDSGVPVKTGDTLPGGNSSASDLVVYDGVPYVELTNQGDTTVAKNTTVWRLDGTTWKQEGTPVDSSNVINDASMELVGNTVYVAFLSPISDSAGSYPVVRTKNLTASGSGTAKPTATFINAAAVKSEYQIGETFDAGDLVVTALLSNNASQTLTYGAGGYTISGFDTSTVGTKTITVTYGSLTTNYTISVLEPLTIQNFTASAASPQLTGTGITLSAAATGGKAGYTYKFTQTYGSTVTTIADGTSASCTWTPTQAASYTLTVTATDQKGKTATSSMSYTINAPAVIPTVTKLTVSPVKTEYQKGETFSSNDITVTAIYSDGSTKAIAYGDNGYTISDFYTSIAGTKTVTVKYGNTTATYAISVLEPLTIQSFTASAASPQLTGTSITLSAEAAGGKAGYTYKFTQTYGSAVTTIAEGTSASCTWTPKQTGSYTLTMTVTDQNHQTVSSSMLYSIYMPSVSYQTHVQNIGWQNYVSDGSTSGTSGQALRLEGIHIKTTGDANLGITYRTHVENVGWQNYVSDDVMSGTSGRALRLEAIQIALTGSNAAKYDVYYRVHAQNYGWMNWAKNGEAAGTEGLGLRLEAIQIVIVKKGEAPPVISPNQNAPFISSYGTGAVRYRTHVQNVGWQGFVGDGSMSGTQGQSLRLEGINISLSPNVDGGIRYRTHIQNIGWESGWKTNGDMSGTSGQALRLEAIQIELTGNAANTYDVYYQVHCQNIGWMGWAKNGEKSGSAGFGYRLEGIRIVLVPKGSGAPTNIGTTNTPEAFRNAQ
jgi:M6 family metalloprotease-like protein